MNKPLVHKCYLKIFLCTLQLYFDGLIFSTVFLLLFPLPFCSTGFPFPRITNHYTQPQHNFFQTLVLVTNITHAITWFLKKKIQWSWKAFQVKWKIFHMENIRTFWCVKNTSVLSAQCKLQWRVLHICLYNTIICVFSVLFRSLPSLWTCLQMWISLEKLWRHLLEGLQCISCLMSQTSVTFWKWRRSKVVKFRGSG